MPNNGRIRYKSASKTVTTTLTSVATNVSTEVFTKNNHGLQNGQRVTLSSIVNTTGINTSTTYVVISASTNTFQLSLVKDGAAVNLTGTNGTCTVTQTNIVSTLISIRDIINTSNVAYKAEIDPASFKVTIYVSSDNSVATTVSNGNLNLAKKAARNALIDLGCIFAIDNNKH